MFGNSGADLGEGPGGPPSPPPILGKKKTKQKQKNTEGRKAGRARKETAESLPRVYSSVPLTYHDPRDLGLICLEKKRKIRFRI